ncbi:MAG: substrate-binding domain-containing protein [Oscillospiraceae bacterium]
MTIAASEIALRCCLLPVLGEYRRKYPGVRLRISNHSTSQAVAALRGGLADLAIVTAADDLSKGLDQRQVKEIQEVPVCNGAFSFLWGRPLTLKELTQYPLIGLGPGTVSFRFFSRIFSERQQPFRLDIETATADQILPFVKAGLGIGFVPEEFLQELPPSDAVQALSLEEPFPKRSVLLLKRGRQILSAAAKKLEQMI